MVYIHMMQNLRIALDCLFMNSIFYKCLMERVTTYSESECLVSLLKQKKKKQSQTRKYTKQTI